MHPPLPLLAGRVQCREVVLEQVDPHAPDVIVEVAGPVHVLHVKVVDRLIGL